MLCAKIVVQILYMYCSPGYALYDKFSYSPHPLLLLGGYTSLVQNSKL